ncbi:MAG TPA: hypothetical protein VIN56_03330 [Candidatus Dormibacteraeota bacterium]
MRAGVTAAPLTLPNSAAPAPIPYAQGWALTLPPLALGLLLLRRRRRV